MEEESRKYTAFDTPVGPHEHCGMSMAFINAGPWFQKVFEGVLEPMLWKKLLQYLDDSLLHAKTEAELIATLDQYLCILDKHNIKLHPGKFLLFAKRLTWCGKQVSEHGLRPSPERVATVNAMPDPHTLSEMMNFVYGIAWFRGHIPHFAKEAAPLYDMWKEALAPYKRKTMNNAKRFKLADIPAWNAVGKEAFGRVKAALAKAITTAFFDPEKKTCVYGDASHEFWCLVLT